MKLMWLGILVVLGLGGVIFFGAHGGSKHSYINGLPGFNEMPNREYITQKTAYVFKDDGRESSYPYIASVNERPELPGSSDNANVGMKIGSLRILDILPIGTRFRIISVRKDESSAETSITYEILLDRADEREYPRLDAYYIVDHGNGSTDTPPPVLGRFAAPRDKT